MTQAVLVYITHENEARAKALGRALVEARLAACANVLAPMTSIYRWEGVVEEGKEAVLLAKTRQELLDELVAFVRTHHGYDCPCVVALPVIGGNPDFLDWIGAETRAPA